MKVRLEIINDEGNKDVNIEFEGKQWKECLLKFIESIDNTNNANTPTTFAEPPYQPIKQSQPQPQQTHNNNSTSTFSQPQQYQQPVNQPHTHINSPPNPQAGSQVPHMSPQYQYVNSQYTVPNPNYNPYQVQPQNHQYYVSQPHVPHIDQQQVNPQLIHNQNGQTSNPNIPQNPVQYPQQIQSNTAYTQVPPPQFTYQPPQQQVNTQYHGVNTQPQPQIQYHQSNVNNPQSPLTPSKDPSGINTGSHSQVVPPYTPTTNQVHQHEQQQPKIDSLKQKLTDTTLTISERLELFLKYEYPRVWFTSQDIQQHYERIYGTIKLSTVSTYLSRMYRKKLLDRRGNRTQRQYMYIGDRDGEDTLNVPQPQQNTESSEPNNNQFHEGTHLI